MTQTTGRLKQRVLYHYLPLLVISTSLLLLMYFITGIDKPIWEPKAGLWRWSMATAYTALALLSTALLIGPYNILQRRVNPLSSDLRRDTGIAAAIVTLIHVVIGLQVHYNSRAFFDAIILYFIPEEGLTSVTVRFMATNYLGLIATIIVLILWLTSNDFAFRKLRFRRWKKIQRLSYWFFGLTVVHGILYQIIEERHLQYVILFSIMILLTSIIQIRGYYFRQNKKKTPHAEDKFGNWTVFEENKG